MQSPFAQFRDAATRARDGWPDEMNRAQTSHENERREINSAGQNERTDFAHRIQQDFSQIVTELAAGTLNVKGQSPALQVTRLQLQQTCARCDEQNNPANPPCHAQTRMK